MEVKRTIANWIIKPVAPILNRPGLNPDIFTWIGFLINIIAAIVIAFGHYIIGGLLILVAGLFDIFDGAVARFNNRETRFGALLDSTFDRLSEAVILFSLLYLSLATQNIVEIYIIFGVLVGSLLISYIRARSEGLGIDCKVGLFTRAERVIILALGLIFNLILVVLVILLIFAFITVVQRLVYVYLLDRRQKNP